VKLAKGEIMTRLNNSVIQLHFNDLTSLSVNKEAAVSMFYMNKQGKMGEVYYEKCNHEKLKTKMRMFNNLLEKLSAWNNNLHQHHKSVKKDDRIAVHE
jgi:hypothetical protein